MALNAPNTGLRAIKHNAISPSKVTISIPAGDTLVVSDELADQLLAAANEFQEISDAVKVNHPDEPVKPKAATKPAKKSAARKSA